METVSFGEMNTNSKEYLLLLRALDECEIHYEIVDRVDLYGPASHIQAVGNGVSGHVEIFIESESISQVKIIAKEVQERAKQAIPSFCPNCDSEKITIETKKRFFGLFEHEIYQCHDCKYEL